MSFFEEWDRVIGELGMRDIEKAKKRLAERIRELAGGVGALPSDMTSQEAKCWKDFTEGAGDWIYDLIKRVILDGTRAWEDEGVPDYIVLDEEESWAGYLINDFLDKED